MSSVLRSLIPLLALALPVWAQGEAFHARLAGTVLDPETRAVPNAAVTLANPATGFARCFVTGPEGQYMFAQVPPGRYQLKVEKEGFATWVRPGIVLAVGQSSTLDPRLEIGPISQVVEVAAETTLLHTGHANLGTEVSGKQAVELPLNIRNMFNLVTLNSAVNNNLEYQAFT